MIDAFSSLAGLGRALRANEMQLNAAPANEVLLLNAAIHFQQALNFFPRPPV